MPAAALAAIPTNLITGRRGAGKSSLILHALKQRPQRVRWAVLVNDLGEIPVGADGISVSEVAEGCICCTAQLPLRTALTRLLREARPERLLIEASSGARTSEVLRLLADQWLLPVLALRATLCVVDPVQFASFADDEIYAGQIARADVVVINRTDVAGAAAIAALLRHLSQLSPSPVVVKTQHGVIDLALLNLPAARVTPRFRSGEPGHIEER